MDFISPTKGRISKEKVFEILRDKIKSKAGKYQVIVGTDSQNTYKTKMVIVICILDEGRGGNYFYHIDWLPKIKSLNTKIFTETEKSLEIARELNEYFHNEGVRADVEIHVDIGKEGKTKDLIQSIIGWVHAEGMSCKIKPYSFVASTIADKISK